MADKEYIEREALAQLMEYAKCSHGNGDCEKCFGDWDCSGSCHDHAKALIADIYNRTPAADVIEIDKVAEMFNDFCGDHCACNYNSIDEWLPFCCDLIEECPEPKDPLGCWKQFIKHYNKRNINFLE